MNDEQLSPFVMSTQEGKYQVIDGNEQTWLETSSEMTAQHYIDLLNKAFNSGFKTGFRKARSG